MKALVTGGAGFIGSNLAKALWQQGYDVIVLDNLLSGYKKNLISIPGVSFVEGDIRNDKLLQQITKDVNVIYHLAASVGNKRSIDYPFVDADINVMGTLNVLEAARLNKVKKIVVSSSAGIFGELKTLPIDESHPVEPRTPYASSKLYAEKVSLSYADLYGLEVVCLRYFNVYGPNQRFDAYGNVIPIFTFKMLRGEPLYVYGDGDQTRDFVNVKDIVQANIKASQVSGLSGVYNIASGTRISVNQLIDDLIKISKMRPTIDYVDPRPGDVRDSLANIRAAQRAFDYLPAVSLRDGLIEYVEWAQSELNDV